MKKFGYNVVSLATIIGIVGDIRRFKDHKRFASYCGFGIREKRSGSSINKSTHITKKGNSRLRQTFHIMALIHINYKKELSKFYFKLKDRGKHPKKCLVATARKLVVIANDTNFCTMDMSFAYVKNALRFFVQEIALQFLCITNRQLLYNYFCL